MTIINMDPDFCPVGKGIDFKQFTFPSGLEAHYKLEPTSIVNREILITLRMKDVGDLTRLELLNDAIRRCYPLNVTLLIPFFPYARQDRIMVSGEPFSLKVAANIINRMKFDGVTVLDPHSDVTLALLDKVIPRNNHSFVSRALEQHFEGKFPETVYMVSPDAGAEKKMGTLIKDLMHRHESVGFRWIKCGKEREVISGHIKHVTVANFSPEQLKSLNKPVFIVDDICDGGGTFELLGRKLHAMGVPEVNLIVTHGIFSKRLSLEGIDHVFTTNSVHDFEAVPDKFNVLDLALEP